MTQKLLSFHFLPKSLLVIGLFIWIAGCAGEDKLGSPSINSLTLNGQSFNTVLLLPDTLVVEALLQDGGGLGFLQVEISPLFTMGMPILPQTFSLDTTFELFGTSSLVSKRIPLKEDSIFGGLYEVSIILVDDNGKRTPSQSSAFKVVNAKPEFLLFNVKDAGTLNEAVPLAFQVRDDQELLDSLSINIRRRFEEDGEVEYDSVYFYQISYQTFSGKLITFNEAFSYPDTGTYELNIKAYSGRGAYRTEFKTDILISE